MPTVCKKKNFWKTNYLVASLHAIDDLRSHNKCQQRHPAIKPVTHLCSNISSHSTLAFVIEINLPV